MATKTVRQRLVTLVVMLAAGALTSIPAAVRSRQLRVLKREYERWEPGSRFDSDLELTAGTPPALDRNRGWWAEAGDRSGCTQFAIRRGTGLASQYALVIGLDAERRVLFKSIGSR